MICNGRDICKKVTCEHYYEHEWIDWCLPAKGEGTTACDEGYCAATGKKINGVFVGSKKVKCIKQPQASLFDFSLLNEKKGAGT
jgi:hypothetical protein